MFDIGKVKAKGSGFHAYYWNPLPEVGLKIYRPEARENGLLEYMVSKYLEPSGFTTEALAFGTAKVRVGVLPYDAHTVIWMKHYVGQTLEELLKEHVKNWCPKVIKGDEARRAYVWESRGFAGYRRQVEEKLRIIRTDFGIELDDHDENLQNFIVEENGQIRVIDFSLDAMFLDDALREKVYKVASPYLAIRMPEEPYYSQLKKAGLIAA